jgi:hypothetical protein
MTFNRLLQQNLPLPEVAGAANIAYATTSSARAQR